MCRILVVDDDLHTRLAIGIWLKRCGFRVAITEAAEATGTPTKPEKPDSPIMIATEE
jgi:CheY-like chemotaxis protein